MNHYYIGKPESYNFCDYSDKSNCITFIFREEIIEFKDKKLKHKDILIPAGLVDEDYSYGVLEIAEFAHATLKNRYFLNKDIGLLEDIIIPYLKKWVLEDERDKWQKKVDFLKKELTEAEKQLGWAQDELDESASQETTKN